MKSFEYFDKRVKELLHDVNTYTLTEHREVVPNIVSVTAELNDTDYHYALEAYLKGRASCMGDTVKELYGGEIGLERAGEILRNVRDEWLPQNRFRLQRNRDIGHTHERDRRSNRQRTKGAWIL